MGTNFMGGFYNAAPWRIGNKGTAAKCAPAAAGQDAGDDCTPEAPPRSPIVMESTLGTFSEHHGHPAEHTHRHGVVRHFRYSVRGLFMGSFEGA